MADTLYDTDLLVIGGGPAGCAAVRTAAGVGLRTVLVEPDRLCPNLYRVPALDNVLGGHTSGAALADAITAPSSPPESGRSSRATSPGSCGAYSPRTPSSSASAARPPPRRATWCGVRAATARPPASTPASSSPVTSARRATSAS